jgi:P-type Cu+ transporter
VFLHIKEIWPMIPYVGCLLRKSLNPLNTTKMEEYYFCSKQCLDEFTQPEKELKKLKMHVAVSIILTIPIVILSLPHMLPAQLGSLFPMDMMHYGNYVMLALATPLQFWIGWRFYRGLWDGIKAQMQRLVDQVAKYFVPAVLALAIGVGLGWYFVGEIGITFSLLAFVSNNYCMSMCSWYRNTSCFDDGRWKRGRIWDIV